MDHAGRADVEAPMRLVDHRFDRPLGHAGIVFELERIDRSTIVAVTHRADKTAHGADPAIVRAQPRDFGGEIEVGGLDRYARQGHCVIVAPWHSELVPLPVPASRPTPATGTTGLDPA